MTAALIAVPPTATRWFAPAVLALGVFAAYANSFGVPFLLDDEPTILRNPTLHSLARSLLPPAGDAVTSSGRPLVNFSLALNRAVGGESPFGYHVVNLVIHFFAACALYGVIVGLTRCWERRRTLPHQARAVSVAGSARPPLEIALVAAAIWALHPLQTEAVTYVVQRAESLMGLFYLLSLYTFSRSVEDGSPNARRWWQSACVVACAFGMATKEVMVSAPLIILLADRTFVTGSWRASWQLRRGLYVGLAATWLVLAFGVLSAGSRGTSVNVGDPLLMWRYALTQSQAIVHYLSLAAWPQRLVFDHGRTLVTDVGAVLPELAVVGSLLVATVYALARRPVVGFFGACFFAVLAPSSSFVPVVTQTVAEHRMYLASAAVLVAFILAVHAWWGRRALFAGVAVALAFGGLTALRNRDYRSAVSIWADTASKRPDNVRAWYSLGIAQSLAGDFPAAEKALQRAVALDPANPEILTGLANALAKNGDRTAAIGLYRRALATLPRTHPKAHEAQHNLGVLLVANGETEAGIAQLREVAANYPELFDGHYSLGNALVASGRRADAVAHYESALALAPDSAAVCANLGSTLIALGRPVAAIPVLELGRAKAPDSAELHFNLALALRLSGRHAEALALWRTFVANHPGRPSGHVELGRTHAALGDLNAAGPPFDRAVALAPDDAGVRYARANHRLQRGEWADAAGDYAEVLRRAPNWAEAHNEHGIALAQLGRRPEARAAFEAALRLKPDDAGMRENLGRLNAER